MLAGNQTHAISCLLVRILFFSRTILLTIDSSSNFLQWLRKHWDYQKSSTAHMGSWHPMKTAKNLLKVRAANKRLMAYFDSSQLRYIDIVSCFFSLRSVSKPMNEFISSYCCNLSSGVVLIVWFTTNGMRAKNKNICMWREQAIIEWSWHVNSIVVCCHSAKLRAYAARDFRSQQYYKQLFKSTAMSNQISSQLMSSHSFVPSCTIVKRCTPKRGWWIGQWWTIYQLSVPLRHTHKPQKKTTPHLCQQEWKRPTPV